MRFFILFSFLLTGSDAFANCADELNDIGKLIHISREAKQTLKEILKPTHELVNEATLEQWKVLDKKIRGFDAMAQVVNPPPTLESNVEALKANWKETSDHVKRLGTAKKPLSNELIRMINWRLLTGLPSWHEAPGYYRELTDTTWRVAFFRQQDVLPAMDYLISRLNLLDGVEHPIRLAAMAWQGISTIGPFSRGNEATALMVANFILLKHGFPALNLTHYRDTLIGMDQTVKRPTQTKAILFITNNIQNTLK